MRRNRITVIITATELLVRFYQKNYKIKAIIFDGCYLFFIWSIVTLPQKSFVSWVIFLSNLFWRAHRKQFRSGWKILLLWLVCLTWSSGSIYFIKCLFYTILLELWDHGLPFFVFLQKDISETPSSSVMEEGCTLITTYLPGSIYYCPVFMRSSVDQSMPCPSLSLDI